MLINGKKTTARWFRIVSRDIETGVVRTRYLDYNGFLACEALSWDESILEMTQLTKDEFVEAGGKVR